LGASRRWPLIDHASPLPDQVPRGRFKLDHRVEHIERPVELIAGIEHVLNVHIVVGPLLDLEEVAIVRIDRIVGFFGPSVRSSRMPQQL
jgi:hypothetical protein